MSLDGITAINRNITVQDNNTNDNIEVKQLSRVRSQPNDYILMMLGKIYENNVFLFTQQINGKRIEYNIEEAMVLFNIMEHLEIKAKIITTN